MDQVCAGGAGKPEGEQRAHRRDRDGNKYYQYYSYYGLPIRREIRFKEMSKMEMGDLVYYQWLYHQVYDPPSELEKEQLYGCGYS